MRVICQKSKFRSDLDKELIIKWMSQAMR
jgi:hypothetical protein